MTSPVVYRTEEELLRHRELLLAEAGIEVAELRARAEEWALDQRELSIWRTIQAIDFLLSDA